MTFVDIVAYVVVPFMCTIGFTSLVLLVGFCFKISNKVTKLETDYTHLNNNVRQGFAGFDNKLEKMDKNLEKLLKYAYRSSKPTSGSLDPDDTAIQPFTD